MSPAAGAYYYDVAKFRNKLATDPTAQEKAGGHRQEGLKEVRTGGRAPPTMTAGPAQVPPCAQSCAVGPQDTQVAMGRQKIIPT